MAVIYGEGQLFFDIRKKSFCEQLNALDEKGRQKVLEEYVDWKDLSDEEKQYFLNAEIKIKTESLLNEDDILDEPDILPDEPTTMLEISIRPKTAEDEYYESDRYFEDNKLTDEELEELRIENEKAIEEYERKEAETRQMLMTNK